MKAGIEASANQMMNAAWKKMMAVRLFKLSIALEISKLERTHLDQYENEKKKKKKKKKRKRIVSN
jgi:hypothetical protein